ncbi:phosphate ABC transporter permease [Mesoplasma lactucae ATCC 49193]|uniref:Phosphate ABC transporter permease n=1 Tax=Mesoplasma lactucae ATCC 49193 TaxID=81460 RepID=A0A291ISF4_9MOLU|nr:phosphate ABC transporter permease [Mesoplasma lactucae ATCC 49193]
MFHKKSKEVKPDKNEPDFKTNSSRPKRTPSEIGVKGIVYLLTLIVVALLLIILVFVAVKSGKIFNKEGFFKFIFVDRWQPGPDNSWSADNTTGSYYGIGGIIASTLLMMVIALLFAVPLTLFSALFISEYMGKKTQKFVMGVIKLMAGIPSVVWGLFAIDQIGPMFMAMGAMTNGNLMTASFTLSFMALPTMLSLTYNALQNVPDAYRYASLGLGISKEETTFGIVRRSSTPKIVSAVIMGMARVIGETMAVILIAGNSAAGLNTHDGFNGFIFSSVKTLAGTIGLEILENAGSLHESALFAIGLILFILVIIINLVVLLVSNTDNIRKYFHNKKKVKVNPHRSAQIDVDVNNENKAFNDYELKTIVKASAANKTSKSVKSGIALFFMWTSTIIVLAFAAWIFGVVIIKGLMGLKHIEAFVTVKGQAGIFAALFTTILLIISTLIFAIPLALGTAIYLTEYANKKSFFTKLIRFMINLLASTPSIVFGIFGLSVFIIMFKLPMSIFASSLTMAIVVIPMLTSNFEDALSLVPNNIKEAGYGLGLSKVKVLFKITIPNAMNGLVTGVILGMAKIIGETAPVYLTLGTALRMPSEGFLASGATLTTEIYMLASEGGGGEATSIAFLFSLVTMILVFFLNWLSGKMTNKKETGSLKWYIKLKNWWSNLIHFDYAKWFKDGWNKFKNNCKIIRHKLSYKHLKEVHYENKKRKKIIKIIEEREERRSYED